MPPLHWHFAALTTGGPLFARKAAVSKRGRLGCNTQKGHKGAGQIEEKAFQRTRHARRTFLCMVSSPFEHSPDQRWGVAPRVYVGENDPHQRGQGKWLNFVIPPRV